MSSPTTYRFALDLSKAVSSTLCNVQLGDTASELVVSFTQGGTPYELTSGMTAVLCAIKSDGKLLYHNCTIDAGNNTVNYAFTSQTANVGGLVSCQIKISSGGTVKSSPVFRLDVQKNSVNENEAVVASQTEVNVLTEYISQVAELLGAIPDDFDTAADNPTDIPNNDTHVPSSALVKREIDKTRELALDYSKYVGFINRYTATNKKQFSIVRDIKQGDTVFLRAVSCVSTNITQLKFYGVYSDGTKTNLSIASALIGDSVCITATENYAGINAAIYPYNGQSATTFVFEVGVSNGERNIFDVFDKTENVDYLTNIVAKGSYSSTASHGYPIQYTDITVGKRYGVHLWNIAGNAASSPKVFIVFPDGHSPANIRVEDSGVVNGAMSATVVVPDDAVKIQVYLEKDENAEYAAADFALADLDETITGNIEKRLSTIESTYTPYLSNVVTKGLYYATGNGEVFKYQSVVAGKRYTVHLWDIIGNSSAANPRIYILSPDGNIEINHSDVSDGALHVPVVVPQGATAIRVYMNKHADAPFASANYALVDEGAAFVGNKLTCKIFKRVVCCGDSYTSGYIKLDTNTVSETNEDYAYPHYLSTMTGNEWLNCGQHGKTVLSWLNAERGLPKAQTLGTAQAYVIGLMINDARQTGGVPAVPVGTASDIGTDSPTTYYGGLSKIIRELNAISPQAKIFVNTIPETNAIYTDYNAAVRAVVSAYAATYHVHCIDLYEYRHLYNIPSLTGDKINSHYTAIGYEQFAEIYAYILSDYINSHIEDFQDVYSLPYNGQT